MTELEKDIIKDALEFLPEAKSKLPSKPKTNIYMIPFYSSNSMCTLKHIHKKNRWIVGYSVLENGDVVNKEYTLTDKDLLSLELTEQDTINHPKQYGGKDNPFEVIKIIEYYNLDFHLGNVLKYILRDKGSTLEDLKKGGWYIDRKIKQMEK